jgi:DNA (cytosine-5)-methyltransferase 1
MVERGKRLYTLSGTSAPWYNGWDITKEKRSKYSERSKESHRAKMAALSNSLQKFLKNMNDHALDPATLMPVCEPNGLKALSLFSGGGGLDLGFDIAGYSHIASYEILDFAANTIKTNRPKWKVLFREAGDVTLVDWREYRNGVDVIHGGPPCQPFSTSGKQGGKDDPRDMIPEFVRAVMEASPPMFVMENVPGLTSSKFQQYLQKTLFKPLESNYFIKSFRLDAASFGVPQKRSRIFYVGMKDKGLAKKYNPPQPTHSWDHLIDQNKEQVRLSHNLKKCMGTREALGLPDIGFDTLAPTLRSGLTGPRHTTSVLSSVSAQKIWEKLKIWPNGVQITRQQALVFPAKNKHYRLSVEDCALLQGFPKSWVFNGPAYKTLGQIGNSVSPPMAYCVARSLVPSTKI